MISKKKTRLHLVQVKSIATQNIHLYTAFLARTRNLAPVKEKQWGTGSTEEITTGTAQMNWQSVNRTAYLNQGTKSDN